MESQVSFNLIEMFVLQNLYLDGFLPELYVVTQCTIYSNLMKIVGLDRNIRIQINDLILTLNFICILLIIIIYCKLVETTVYNKPKAKFFKFHTTRYTTTISD